MRHERYLILHNIRSLYNVGAIFRTADAAGVSKMYLTGYTPSPLDQLGNVRKEISKVALHAETYVLWEKRRDIHRVIRELKSHKVQIVALEQAKHAVDYRVFKPKFPLAILLGNEVRGLSKALLRRCDSIVKIPMYGRKESLNVAVAAGIALFSLCDK